MRVLVTNHHLDQRCGSELATAEVARELARRGHDTAVFTLVAGTVAAELRERTGIPVLTPSDAAVLRRFAPEVTHVHHWPTIVVLEQLGVIAPWVIGIHGGIPALEQVPPLRPGADVAWWGMCRGTMERVRSDPTWARQPHRLINNWFDDTTCPRREISGGTLRRMLVVSNHFPEGLRVMLDRACRSRGIGLDHVGLPDRSISFDPQWLGEFDALVTTGRTAVLGQALGLPVLVADHLGADGWITPSTRAQIAARNYSGAAIGHSPNEDLLTGWLDDPPPPADLRILQEWVFERATLTQAVDQLAVLYQSALPNPPSQVFGRWAEAVADYAMTFAATMSPRTSTDSCAAWGADRHG